MAKRLPVLWVVLALLGCAQALSAQQAEWTLESTTRYRNVSAPVVSPDGSRAAVVVTEPAFDGTPSRWRSTLHIIALGGSRAPTTMWTEPDASAPAWSPDGKWLGFASARSGARNVWRVPANGGSAEAVTSLASGVGEFHWSPDGRWLGFVAVDNAVKSAVTEVGKDYRFARLYITDANAQPGRSVKLLTPQDVQVGGHVGAGLDGPAFTWAPDASAIAFTHSPSPLGDDWVNADVSLVDVATRRTRPLIVTKAAEGGVTWSPDGKWIAVAVTDSPATYALTSRIHLVSARTGEIRPLAESFDRRPSLVGWSADSRRVIIAETRSVVARLSALPVDGTAAIDLSPDTLLVSGAQLGARGSMVGFVSESPERAPEGFVAQLASFQPRRITSIQPHLLATSPRTDVVRWHSFDGRTIEGLLTYPIGWKSGQRVPLLVIVHGGPPSAFMNGFTGRLATYPIAVFAQRGFAVLRPNVRGSSGYGRDFRYANMKDWGGGDHRDVMAGIDSLAARGLIDPDRIGIMGWSYGGYLTAISITRTTRFKAASVGAGITDLVSFSGTADIPGFVPSYYGADFWDDADAYRRGSAIANVANVTTPTLIQHGELDQRVPIGQGYQLYYALERRGIPVRMLVYPGQGHSLSEPALILEAARANLEWFERWLPARP